MKQLTVLLVCLAGCGAQGPGKLRVDSISPSKGSARGGQRVTLSGSGFTTDTVVKFNGRAARVVDAQNGTLLVRTPAGLAGAVSIDVSDADDALAVTGSFEYERLSFTFTDATEVTADLFPIEGSLFTLADFGRDGDKDVFQAARGEGVSLLENEGGRLTQRLLNATALATDGGVRDYDAFSVGAADFNGDRKLDLFVGTAGKTPSVLLLGGEGDSFTDASDELPPLFGDSQRVTVIDADNDGDDDLLLTASAATAAGPFTVKLLINDGAGHFTDASARIEGTALAPAAIATGDFDRDGDTDLFFSMATETCRLFLGDGAGAFALAAPDALPVDSQPHAGQAAVGDLDEDGTLDLYIPTDTQDQVWLNDGTAHFANLTEASLSPEVQPADSAQFADLDLDGHLDVVVVERNSRLRFLRNDGSGRLYDYSATVVGNDSVSPARDVLVFDAQNDGVPEVLLSRGNVARAALFIPPPDGEKDTDEDGWVDSLDACFDAAATTQSYRAPFGCRSDAECMSRFNCGLRVFGESAYLSCAATSTWDAAKNFCIAHGGTLAALATPRENAAVVAGVGGNSWLAINDVVTEGTFVANGTPPSWTNWADGEPNNAGGLEDCGLLSSADGKWNDADCSTMNRVLCETSRMPAGEPSCPVADGGTP